MLATPRRWVASPASVAMSGKVPPRLIARARRMRPSSMRGAARAKPPLISLSSARPALRTTSGTSPARIRAAIWPPLKVALRTARPVARVNAWAICSTRRPVAPVPRIERGAGYARAGAARETDELRRGIMEEFSCWPGYLPTIRA